MKSKTFSKADLNKSCDTVFYSFKDSSKGSIKQFMAENKIKKVDAQVQTSGQFNGNNSFDNTTIDHSEIDKKMSKSKLICDDKSTSSASKVLDRHRKEYEMTRKLNSNFIQDYANRSLNKTAVLNEFGKDLISKSVNKGDADRSSNKSADKLFSKSDKFNATGSNVIKNLRKEFKSCSTAKNDVSSGDESIEPFESNISTVTLEESKDGTKELYIDSEFNITFINETKNGLLSRLETSDSNLNDSQLLIRLDELNSTLKNNDSKLSIEINVQINRFNDQDDYDSLDDDQLFSELLKYNFRPGPINANTRSLYIKKLIELKKVNSSKINNEISILSSTINEKLKITDSPFMFSKPLREMMNGRFDFRLARQIENEFIQNFENQSASKKKFFNYLLLDPRITQNLVKRAVEESPQLYSQLNGQLDSPKRSNNKSNIQQPNAQSTNHFNLALFKLFILAIFYIGKGQGNRPYMHLYDAAKLDQAQRETRAIKKSNIKKLNKIQEIWNSQHGVISLHCFNNLSDIESLSRECLMIDAIGIKFLTNIQIGQNRIKNLRWTQYKKDVLGAYFLYKAYNMLLVNGERQLKRADITLTK